MQRQIPSSFRKRIWKISTAETKIILVLCFYALFSIIALTYFSIGVAHQEDEASAIQQYFICEATGSGMDCDRSGFDHFGYRGLAVLFYWLLGFIPAVNLIFVINWTMAKASVKRTWKRYSKNIFSTQTTFINAKQIPTITDTGV